MTKAAQRHWGIALIVFMSGVVVGGAIVNLARPGPHTDPYMAVFMILVWVTMAFIHSWRNHPENPHQT